MLSTVAIAQGRGAMSRSGSSRRWLWRGIASGLAGIVFSILLSALVAFLAWVGVGWVQLLERRGTDFTMRTAVALRSPVVDELGPGEREAVDPILFLDIDEVGCERLSVRPRRCRTHGVGQPSVLIPIGEALRRSGARLVVLDIRWPDPESFDPTFSAERMVKAWAARPGPPVVAALPGALSSSPGVAVDWDVVAGMPRGRLRFAPSAIWPGETAGDTVIRAFPDEVPIVGDLRANWPDRLASMPVAVVESLGRGRAVRAADPLEGRRILFTLPSLAANPDEALASLHLGSWERRALAGMMTRDPACPTCPVEVGVEGLRGQIVIVGSSAPAADDLHMSPLGIMAGAELIANAIRARQLAAAAPPPEPGRLFWEKLIGTFPAMLVSFGASLAIARLSIGTARRNWRRSARIVMTFLSALAVSLLLNFWLALGGLLEADRMNIQVDLLLPTLALFLEGFVAFARWFIDSVEEFIQKALRRLADRQAS